VPVGSCSTLAGLTLGVKLSGLNSKVIGIRVAPAYLGPFPACTEGEVNKVIKQAAKQMQKWGIKAEQLALPPRCHFSDDFYGEGYGMASAASQSAIEIFKAQGITLENTYTGKAAAAFLQQLNKEDQYNAKPQLFWQTFNSANTLAQIELGLSKKETDSPTRPELSPKLKAYLAD